MIMICLLAVSLTGMHLILPELNQASKLINF